jgi:nucleotide-binding universal stress UspA family protein
MYRRILVPVDGSATSKLGLRHAVGLAKNQGARLRFLNVMDDSLGLSGTDISAADMSFLLKSVREIGERSVTEAAVLARKNKLNADASLLHGRGRRASDVILEAAKKWRADLIVMGTHGRRGLNRLLLGSDAERVLRGTPVPLLLVRDPAEGKRARRSR